MIIKKSTTIKIFLIFITALLILQPVFGFAQEKKAKTLEDLINEETSCGLSNLWGCVEKAFASIALWIGRIIGYVAGFLLTFAAGLIEMLLGVSEEIFSNRVVTEGFKISLSVVNLGFVLIMIIIAVATILRFQQYGYKQLLWKLIVAAVLINFSFAIVGVFLDFTNILGNWFLGASVPSGNHKDLAAFGENLANSLNVPLLISQGQESGAANLGEDILKVGSGFFGILASIAAIAIFSVVLVVTFFAVAFFLLVRYVYLVFLIILMPLAWLFWIMPNLSHHWQSWWRTFLKWTFFFPAITFFIYLAILSSQTGGLQQQNGVAGTAGTSNSAAAAAANFTDQKSPTVIIAYLQMILQVALVGGGLYAATQFGIAGADLAMGAAKTSSKWIAGTAGRIAARPAVIAGRPVARTFANVLNAPVIRNIPGAKTAVARLNQFGSRQKEIEDYKKNYLDKLTPEQLASVLKSPPSKFSPIANAAKLEKAAEMKKLGLLTAGLKKPEDIGNRLKQYANIAAQTHPGTPIEDISSIKALYKANPDLAPALTNGKVSKEEASRKVGPADAESLNVSALADQDVVINFSPSVLSAIMARSSQAHIENLRNTLESIVGEPLKEIAQNINKTQRAIREAKIAGDKTRVSELQADLRKLIGDRNAKKSTLPKEGALAYDKLEYISQQVGRFQA